MSNALRLSTVQKRMSKPTQSRIRKEIEEIREENLVNFTAGPVGDNLLEWSAKLYGPPGSVYEGGVFRIRLVLPTDYPFHPPKVTFMTKVYHCNISTCGRICLDILDKKWNPSLTITKVLLSISSLLVDCNPNDPLVGSIARLYIMNRDEYNRKAREYTKQYAKDVSDAADTTHVVGQR